MFSVEVQLVFNSVPRRDESSFLRQAAQIISREFGWNNMLLDQSQMEREEFALWVNDECCPELSETESPYLGFSQDVYFQLTLTKGDNQSCVLLITNHEMGQLPTLIDEYAESMSDCSGC